MIVRYRITISCTLNERYPFPMCLHDCVWNAIKRTLFNIYRRKRFKCSKGFPVVTVTVIIMMIIVVNLFTPTMTRVYNTCLVNFKGRSLCSNRTSSSIQWCRVQNERASRIYSLHVTLLARARFARVWFRQTTLYNDIIVSYLFN